MISVIVRDRPRLSPPLPASTPDAVRIGAASQLTDHDPVVGCVEEVTDESREACATDPDALCFLNGVFFRRPYTVDGPDVDGDGWVTLRSNCWVWRSTDLVLYVSRDYC
ncbi:hypothetical protein [Streptomyces chartreusis]|uniref:hypothetical protein n=1 Tax=Streptomyces chartreusis TaxID=1969 RepID=UPI0036CB6515